MKENQSLRISLLMRLTIGSSLVMLTGFLIACCNSPGNEPPIDNSPITWTVQTFAGSNSSDDADGTGTAARFNNPMGIAVAANGNLYVADGSNNKIRMITPGAVVTTFAGPPPGTTTSDDTDGTGTTARFNYPSGIAIDKAGNIYVSDYYNNKIRMITPGAVVTTFAGPPVDTITSGDTDATGTAARFNNPGGLVFDAKNNLFVAEYPGNKIRMITPGTVVTTFAGPPAGGNPSGDADATGTAARFGGPRGMAIDALGNIYVSDYDNEKIRKITPAAAVTTFAGLSPGVPKEASDTDGTGTKARFSGPNGITIDAKGNLYIADASNNKIRKITANADVSTIAGPPPGTNPPVSGDANGAGTDARFNFPMGIAIDANGNLYVTEYLGNKIRKLVPSRKG